MGHLRDGRWTTDTHFPTDDKGAFVRGKTAFRREITADGGSGFGPTSGRYHLYVSYACPWAHRVLIARTLYGLEDAISLAVSHPLMLEQGWEFGPGHAEVPDDVLGVDTMWQVYTKADPNYSGRVTVPALWDRETSTIVNNESRELIRMLGKPMRALHRNDVDLCPDGLRSQIDDVLDRIYNPINNGVYRSGFARTQAAYEAAVTELFAALDEWEGILGQHRYTVGDTLTEADICLFTTLVRFDVVYATHFKCNIRRIVDYPNLWGFVRDIYQTPGVAQTCNFEHIKRHYFGSHESVNPTRIVPVGPAIDFETPHGRG